jgi:hypothetical protein
MAGSRLIEDAVGFVALRKVGDFNGLSLGVPADKATTLLWTVDQDGI